MISLVPVVFGVADFDEFNWDLVSEEERTAVVEVDPFVEGLARKDGDDAVLASGSTAGFARIFFLACEMQERAAATAQTVFLSPRSVTRSYADEQLVWRLRRFTGIDRKGMPVELSLIHI